MNEGRFEDLTPLVNIFSIENGRGPGIIAEIVLITSLLSMGYIFGPTTQIGVLCVLSGITVLFILAVKKRKKSHRDNLKHGIPDEAILMELRTDFSWDSSIQNIRNRINVLGSISEYLGTEFTMFSMTERVKINLENRGPITASLNNIWKSRPEVFAYRSYIYMERISGGKDAVSNLISSLGKHGVEAILISGERKREILEKEIWNTSGSVNFKNFYYGREKSTNLILTQLKGGILFQISRFVMASNLPLTTVVRFQNISKETPNFKRTISKVLTRYRIVRESNRSVGSMLKSREEAAKELRRDIEKYYFNVEALFSIRADKSYDLTRSLSSLENYSRLWGVNLKIPDHRNSEFNLLSKSKRIVEFPQTKGKIVSFFPILYEKSTPGVILGTEDQTGIPFAFDPFSMSSYNVLVLGETGSGKSFFSKILISRLISFNRISRILILDVLNEYVEDVWNNCVLRESPKPEDIEFKILKCSSENLYEKLQIAWEFMGSNKEKPSLILIQEAHTFLRDKQCSELLVEMIKVSRHFLTSILIISQDTNDFTTENGKKILNNTMSLFIFRNKLMSNLHKFGINPEDYGFNTSQISLLGGKNNPFSNALFYSQNIMKKLKIEASEWELANLS